MAFEAASVPISAVMICRDAEATIRATLETLAAFEEVVVYDNGSTDDTVAVAREFPNVSLYEGDFYGFGPTKNHAAGLARHDWIWSIDSDERVSAELLASIAAVDRNDPSVAYSVLRANYLRGRKVRHSGWGGDWLVRLYNRLSTAVSDAPVHENVLPPAGGRVEKLRGELAHDAVREIGEFLIKVDRYSEIRRRQPRRILSPPLIFLRSVWAFIRVYILYRGFLDGWRGLTIAVSEANGVFFKYMKPYVDRHE